MKIKSVSVENLGNIVRQMVNVALKDSDQITKLHQAIYEEWYFKKMMELGVVTSKMENKVSYPLSNLASNISDRDNLMDTSNEIKYLMKQDPDNIKIIKHDESSSQDIHIMCNKSVEANVCTKYSERTYSEISENKKCMINNNNVPDLAIIEVWNHPMQGTKIKKELDSNITDHQNRNQNKRKLNQLKKRLSFESWRKEKNLMYRKLLKEAEEKKQEELKDIQCKRASQEAYAQIKEKEIQQKRKLSVKQLEVTQQMNIKTLQKQIGERHIINDQTFNVWKKQKDVKLKEGKLTTKNVSYHQVKRSRPSITLTDRSSLQFDSWLNQLDNVLHQKYLRERRHLVRSFYCQPTYYSVTTCYT